MLLKQMRRDHLEIRIYDTRAAMGAAAAQAAAEFLLARLEEAPEANVIFPAAPSQNEVLAELASSAVDFRRVNAFHLDEYLGLPQDAPQRFSAWLRAHVFDLVPLNSVHLLAPRGDEDPEAECARYARLLEQYPADLALIGIGENGHIAFNDPHVADFQDPRMVKTVTLDKLCRTQQVNDGAFPALEQVPENAYTLTIPALLRAGRLICTVPAAAKAPALTRAVTGEISHDCPASILRTCPHCTLFCDADSGRHLLELEG